MHIMRVLLLLTFLVGLVACGGADVNADVATVRTRASFDLSCPETEVRGRWLDDKTLGVTACGQRATYVKVCHSDVTTSPLAAALSEECQWILNSDSHKAPQ
jgi:hypothetical protein